MSPSTGPKIRPPAPYHRGVLKQYVHSYRGEVAATLILATPIVATQVAHISLSFVDTIMVGRLGPESLAGIALGNTVFFTLIVMAMGIVMAVGPMVSQAFGAGEQDPIGRSVRQGLWLSLCLALVVMVVYENAYPLLVAAGQEPATAALAAEYLSAIKWSAFPFLGFIALRNFVEGVSRPRAVTAIAFLGVGLNVLANWVLMFGKWGFPELGLVGTGWASSIVHTANCLLLAAFIATRPEFRPYQIFSKLGRPDFSYFRQLFRIGWPIGASFGVETTLFMGTLLMMGWIGTTSLAAHQVAIQCAAFTFMIPLGIGLAASVRVGQAVGRGDAAGARRAGIVSTGLSVVFMTLTALLFWLAPRFVVGIYLDLDAPANAEVIQVAVGLLSVAAFFQIADGVQVSLAGALRGFKDTAVPMVIAVVSYLGIGLAAGYTLGFTAGYGGQGLWWGLVIGLAVAATLLLFRFRRLSSRALAPTGVAARGPLD
ncbi:MAG: MATE family efflux transporter [Rhodothermales bacterium]|nr:MATE family efflux transporter [Rhodothermales bacterium]